MERIEGKIVQILFKNEENSYAVVRIKIDYTKKEMAKYRDILYTNLLTVTSYFDNFPNVGEEFLFEGDFTNTKYGISLKATTFKRINVDTLESIIAYLSSDIFPGIGVKIATNIYEALGKDCLEKIAKDKKELDKVYNINNVQKDTIYTGIIENKKREKDTIDYINMGFSIQMARKILFSLTNEEIELCKKNPYLLIDKVNGIGFIKADSIAFNIGIALDDPIRIQAVIKYVLDKLTQENGNTYTTKELLYQNVYEYINIDEDKFTEHLEYLNKQGKIYIEENRVYEYFLYASEGKLASIIASKIVLNNQKVSKKKLNNAYEKLKAKLNMTYTDKQEEAIKQVYTNKIMVITGGPGTGKSTIVNGIVNIYKELYPKSFITKDVFLLAPTGRAAKRLSEVTTLTAQTIHKFLQYDGKSFHNNENNQIKAKLVIVDETSMVDSLLAYNLFSTLTSDTRIVLVGDVDQIPSVAAGNVLEDVIKTGKVKTIKLDKIHRQASDSTIIRLAHEVNHGIIPQDILNKQKDRNFIYMKDEKDISESIVKIVNKAKEQKMSILKDIQILIPMYKRSLGIDNINNILQDKFNPITDNQNELIFGKQRFRINDKVIQLVNRNNENITNGDIGIIESFIYNNDKIIGLYVRFDNDLIEYNQDTYSELKLAYAISIHKSQGSEFNTVIIPFSLSYSIMLKRRLYYTAITRAKKFLIMIGDFEAFRKAVNNSEYERNTRLKEKIIENITNFENNKIDKNE